jgi:DNA invertase Pin-like site-specific DNA recombinase
MKRYVAYLRTSTRGQDYGIEAQRDAVNKYLNALPHPWELVGSFEEHDSGANNLRVNLQEALKVAQSLNATLVIAKLCRLSRDAAFCLTLQNSGVDFVCCDMPYANKLTIGLMAVINQHDREMISLRTREALKVVARSKKLGNPNYRPAIKAAHIAVQTRKQAFNADIINTIREIQETANNTLSYERVAEFLNRRGYVGRRGGAFTGTTVRRIVISAGA